jgi:hypothetical protein
MAVGSVLTVSCVPGDGVIGSFLSKPDAGGVGETEEGIDRVSSALVPGLGLRAGDERLDLATFSFKSITTPSCVKKNKRLVNAKTSAKLSNILCMLIES